MSRTRAQRMHWARCWLAARCRRVGDWVGCARNLAQAAEQRTLFLNL